MARGQAPSKTQVPSVIAPVQTTNGQRATVSITSQERQAFNRLRVTPNDLKGADGALDPAAVATHLSRIQDNIHDATITQRSSPLGLFNIVQQVALTNGQNTRIPHGLGAPFAYYQVVRARSGSPFAAVEVADNDGEDPSQFLVLVASATGVYDIAIYAS